MLYFFHPLHAWRYRRTIVWFIEEVQAHVNETQLPYQYNHGKKNCLSIIGEELFAPPGLLTFFCLTTVCLVQRIFANCETWR